MENKDSSLDFQTKFPLRRFDVALRKFTDVAIPLHLQLLNKHRENISNFQASEEWDKVHREQVNASRTIQQLKADIWEVDKLRQQVLDDDVDKFEERVSSVRKEALDAVQEFIECHKGVTDPTRLMFRGCSEDFRDYDIDDDDDKEDGLLARTERSTSVDLKKPPNSANALESWRNLQEDLVSLNHIIHDFNAVVHQQQESVDRIEDNLETAEENVAEGTKDLCKASKYKMLLYPVTVAAMGCIAAAPVGLFLGLKIGALAAFSGGLIGYTGGRHLKQKNDECVEVEMVELSHANLKGSLSLPELNNLPEKNGHQKAC